MTDTRKFKATDLFSFNNINLDPLTETFNISFYLSYLNKWPSLCVVQESDLSDPTLMGYIMGKSEGTGKEWHTHVTAITVAPNSRRLGLARTMMDYLETVGNSENAFFVDLFVRASNALAIDFYKGLGYSVYRRVIGYYSNPHGKDEDSFDMRKPLSRDVNRESIRENGENFKCSPADVSF
ncbi:N-terminal acetyltransferase B complex catalytic subunit naa20 [Schizosaccharomyces pombe]|uniref:N-terminal acetyltransferase B complex catalytic subunit naa20 n=1 Tax=Schizosaccharomyces pombe (strain 972 / ATCC 24843) TaxID=284812 RepID=NAT3_SCHPO|nr:putative NatB N-acetyltransferase complex catalytic subunit Naa20 [Schizosaccharomyces pombe]O74457.1 RecName: Full=N-terminal acetyltransferase B complex catalytic subunit naa20; Short=NatB complex subunit naa20; AltName: Full=NatB Nalpha terminal acetyltransferase 3 [Schizosaccharomyces pombe 972h-]CAA20751.1 NatB N-acetyltransferase complex catalytic subunit Naa20 (predicted) [Schizosaccharomyces pombe]|eukprot:NP_587922.1 putative NatB N-acetyltransferase complex catalytic subunit Naa20 [Schizosaccharomyces pombe]